MDAHAVLQRLTSERLHLSAIDGGMNLEVKPKPTPEQRALIRQHKAALLRLLAPAMPGPAVIQYRLAPSGGGTVIDNAGDWLGVVRDLVVRYGDRLDMVDLIEWLEERAAIMEVDGGLSRPEAERQALVLAQAWLAELMERKK